MKRDFISAKDISKSEIFEIFRLAEEMRGKTSDSLRGKKMALIFEKPSLRTRVSFEVAMMELGGKSIYLSRDEVGLGKREPARDIAKVLSRYVDVIVARVFEHDVLYELAENSSVPVINALSDLEHPCQALADFFTIREVKPLGNLKIAYIGDGNNVAGSLYLISSTLGVKIKFSCPEGYELPDRILDMGDRKILTLVRDPREAVKGADVIYTDVWTSMGMEHEAERRRKDFEGFKVTKELLSIAGDAILMHPMPVHWGEELEEGLLEHPRSVLIKQAENRLHIQKALLLFLLG